MRLYSGWVKEVRLGFDGQRQAWIACPAAAIPAAGRYLLAHAPAAAGEPGEVLPLTLFPEQAGADGFLAASSIPAEWEPGTGLELRGPLGHGFHLPENAQRIALAALGETLARLMPLTRLALERNTAVALFTDAMLPPLPAALEAHPLNSLAEALSWADYLAIDLPAESLTGLRQRLGLSPAERLPCPAQALILSPMPCGGMAECGACAVPARRGWKLACKDGPVFDLETLSW